VAALEGVPHRNYGAPVFDLLSYNRFCVCRRTTLTMEKTLHISQTGANWEVEDQTQTLAQAESKAEAIEAAMEAALEHEDVEQIVVHTSDGAVEKSIPVRSKSGEPAQSGKDEAAEARSGTESSV
jgi:hypothetical protein